MNENNGTKNENEKSKNKNININNNNQKGRLLLKRDDNNLNNIFLNNTYNNHNKAINIEKSSINKNNLNIDNNDIIIKKGHHYFKSDLTIEINNKIYSTTKGEKVIVTSKSFYRNDNIYTPNNKDNKTLKLLKGNFLKQNNNNNKYNII